MPCPRHVPIGEVVVTGVVTPCVSKYASWSQTLIDLDLNDGAIKHNINTVLRKTNLGGIQIDIDII